MFLATKCLSLEYIISPTSSGTLLVFQISRWEVFDIIILFGQSSVDAVCFMTPSLIFQYFDTAMWIWNVMDNVMPKYLARLIRTINYKI